MKKIIASASLVAVGAAGLQGANAPGLTRTQTSKPWSVSASLRGFYDDNYATAPSGSDQDQDSYGFEVSPMASINLPWQQSYLGASYRYSMKYYDDREKNSADHTHLVNIKGDHRFSERYDVFLDESFVYAQEPELVEPGGSPIRSNADAFRNHVKVGFNARLTELVGVGLSYYNGWYDYDDEGPGSRSAVLDRFEHLINLDGRYQMRETIAALAGYQFGMVNYNDDELLFDPNYSLDPTEKSDIRDSTSHYFYVGADGELSAKVLVSSRIGVQYTDFDDLDEDSVTPYINNTLTYSYLPGSYFQIGVTHRRNATDVAGTTGDVVTDQESTSIYGQVRHRITPKLTGTLLIQGQFSEFNEGEYDGDKDKFLLLGANLDYEINQFLAAEAGYNLDRLDSDLPDRSFTRNRVYLGLRASY